MRRSGEADTVGMADRDDACPHLGIEGNSALRYREPSPQHRCYLRMQLDRIDLAHQANFCLTDSHVICPWLSIDAPLRVRLSSRTLPLRLAAQRVVSRLSPWLVALAAEFWIWLRPAMRDAGHLAAALAVAVWRWVRLAVGRLVRFLGPRVKRGLLGLGRLVVRSASGRLLPPRASVEPTLPPAPTDAPDGTPGAAELVENGILALREGSREVAHALFVRASELDPGSEDGWLWRAALSRSAEEKRECLEHVLRVNPANASAKTALPLLDQPTKATHPAARPPVHPDTLPWRCAACETINTGSTRVCRACGRPSPQVEEELMSSGDEFLAEGLAGLKTGNEELAYGYFVVACKASPDNELAWQWRAKTAPTLDEVIKCLERLVEINPGNVKAQADLRSALQRREREHARPDLREQGRVEEGRPQRATSPTVITGELRWWLLQIAGFCAFTLALVLMLPYVLRLAGPPSKPELEAYLALLPGVGLPRLTVQAPGLPAFDLAVALPLMLGPLLLHAAFIVASGGGLGARIWTALLSAASGGLMLFFGTNPPAPWYAAGLAALAVAAALAGGAPATKPPGRDGTRY